MRIEFRPHVILTRRALPPKRSINLFLFYFYDQEYLQVLSVCDNQLKSYAVLSSFRSGAKESTFRPLWGKVLRSYLPHVTKMLRGRVLRVSTLECQGSRIKDRILCHQFLPIPFILWLVSCAIITFPVSAQDRGMGMAYFLTALILPWPDSYRVNLEGKLSSKFTQYVLVLEV